MNPIYASDIFQNDGAIKSFTDDLAELRKETSLTKKQAEVVEDAIRNLTGATEEQQDAIERQLADARKVNAAYKRYQASLSDTSLAIAKLKEETRENNRITALTVKLNKSEAGSYDNLSAQYSLLKIKLNKMGGATKEAAAEKAKLEKKAKSLYEEMKRLQEQTGKNTLNVGNYGSALEGLGGPIGDAIGGVKDLGLQFKALLRNPVALAIAAIVGALVALGRAFTKSEKGAALLAKASGALEGVMSALVDISVDLSEKAEAAFADPQQAIKDFGSLIVGQVLNRFKGVIDVAVNAGKAIAAFFSQDDEGLQEALRGANTAIAQVLTGLDAIQQRDLAGYLSETSTKISEQAELFAALAARKREVAIANTNLIKQSEKLRTEEELYQQVADDTTLSLRQQTAALEEALVAGQKRIQLEIQLSKNNLSILNQEIALRRQNGEDVVSLLEQQAGAVTAVEGAERELAIFRADAARQRREIARDAFERELDFAIDLFDAEKTRLERIASNSENELGVRTAALAKIIELDRSAFAEQIKLTEGFTKERINLAELALIEDERIVRDRLRLLDIDDVSMGRILEILRERKAITQDIKDLEQVLGKERAKNGAADIEVLSGANRELERQLELRDQLALSAARRITREVEDDDPQDLYDLLGINIGEDEKQALADATAFAVDQIKQLSQAKVDAANRAVEASDREVDAAQRNLDNTIELAQLGYAVNLEQAQNELQLAEDRQRESLKQKEKAEREQRTIESLQQATSLATASARILAEVPFPANLFAVGTMLGTFAFAKIRAARLSRQFRKGNYSIISGPPHEGGGVFEGTAADGVDEYSEGGEGRAIFSRKAVRKYGKIIPDVVNRINAMSFGERSEKIDGIAGSFAFSSVNQHNIQNDNSGVEKRLDQVRNALDKPTYTTRNGKLIEIYKNRTRTYAK